MIKMARWLWNENRKERPFFKPPRRPITLTRNLETYGAPWIHPVGLDATCGFRRMWRGRDMRGWVFVDWRPRVRPDVVCSNEYLPFRPQVFQEILFDPPSLLAGGGYFMHSHMAQLYSAWPGKKRFRENLDLVNEEFLRILRPAGQLNLKYTESKACALHFREVIGRLTNFNLQADQTRPSRTGNKASLVHMAKLAPKPCLPTLETGKVDRN
jgi:hypothetical protein